MKKKLPRIAAIYGIGIVIVGILSYAVIVFATAPTPAPTTQPKGSASLLDKEIKIVNVEPARMTLTNNSTTYPGLVQAFQTANLVFRVGGPLIDIMVKPGDSVKKGDVLMQIDPRDFENDVQNLESQKTAISARLQAMKVGARKEDILLLKSTVEAAKARSDFADQEFLRSQKLREQHTIAQSELEERQHNQISARMSLRIAEQELAKGEAGAREEDVAATEADVKAVDVRLRIAQDRLNDTSLRAPFDGIVTNKTIDNYEMVTTTPTYKEVIGLHDISKLKIRVFLPDKELIHRSIGKDSEATIVFTEAPSKSYRGKVYEIDTRPHGEANGLYAVVFLMAAPQELHLLPGMVAEVVIDGANAPSEKKLVVPATAVLGSGDGQNFVWCVDDTTSTAVKKVIKRGSLTQDNHYVVLAGLREGDQVITDGNRFLSEGVKVTIAP